MIGWDLIIFLLAILILTKLKSLSAINSIEEILGKMFIFFKNNIA